MIVQTNPNFNGRSFFRDIQNLNLLTLSRSALIKTTFLVGGLPGVNFMKWTPGGGTLQDQFSHVLCENTQ